MRYLLALLLVISFAQGALAQAAAPKEPFRRWHYGAVIGYGAVGLKTDDRPTAYPAAFRGTFTAGLLGEYDFSARYGLRAELLYEAAAGSTRFQDEETPFTSSGFAIPVMVRIDMDRGFTYSLGVINSFSQQRTYFTTDAAGATLETRETGSLYSLGIYSDLGIPLPSEHMEVSIRLGGDVTGKLRRTLFQAVWVVRI